jgi:AMIN domain
VFPRHCIQAQEVGLAPFQKYEGFLQRFGHSFLKSSATCLLLAITLLVAAAGQTGPGDASVPAGVPAVPVAMLKSVRYVVEANGPAIEIVSTWPIVPAIRLIESPWRLLIDLPNARVGKVHKETSVKKEYVTEIRIDQFQEQPPVTRIVLDLIAPYGATWDSAGNRLMVRLKPPNDPTASRTAIKPPSVVSLSREAQPAVIPVSSGTGPVSLAGNALAAGSNVSAGEQTAVLSLSRGGEIRVCPKTTVSVNASKNSSELMVSMSSGALETHYRLDATADSVMTPDFRILFPGPGEFHYAISTEANGDTCVRALTGNSSSVIVSELLGDRTYQVKPFEQAVFRGGQIDKVDTNVPLECGCPPPSPAQLMAQASSRPLQSLPTSAELSQGAPKPAANTVLAAGARPAASPTPPAQPPTTLSSGPEIAPPPASQAGDVRVEVDAPMVFSAKDRKAASPPPPPVLAEDAAPIRRPLPAGARIDTRVQPPPRSKKTKPPATQPAGEQPATTSTENKGFFHKVRSFFGSIFK